MIEDRDLYQAFYTDYLWRLLPEVYRAADSDDLDSVGPLRELVARLGAQIAVVRRSIDRTVEDQSIESCDDWLIPYIGELFATNLVAGLDARAQRLDVAKTIYYRRRKGTLAVLEELAADITGWNARAVEFFRRLARTRHGLDPGIGLDRDQAVIAGLCGALSGTAAGGLADLRHAGAAENAGTAFDEFFHTADFRRGRDGSGWHNIPRLGFFLWRLRSYRDALVDPVEHAACPGQFTFDPTGREIPLFSRGIRDLALSAEEWTTPDEWMLPDRISTELLRREAVRLYPDSLAVLDVSNAGTSLVGLPTLRIIPERGRFQTTAPPAPGVVRLVTYHHGFSSEIGAGPYDRGALPIEDLPHPAPAAPVVAGGGAQLLAAQAALGATGSIAVLDSRTYTAVVSPWNVADVLLHGGENQCPVVRLTGSDWIIEGTAGASLAIEGLLISGVSLVLRGVFDTVTLSCTTVDPGQEVGPDGAMPQTVDGRDLRPSTIWIEGQVRELVLRRAICGPIRTRGAGAVERIRISDSIVQGVRTAAAGLLTAAEIADPHRLARRLRAGLDPLSAFLAAEFDPTNANALAAWNPESPADSGLIDGIVDELNAVLGGGPLYSATRFAAVPLPAALQPPPGGLAGAELLQVNRQLLEAAFPLELQPVAIATATGHVELERTTVLGALYAHRISASESILHAFSVAEDAQSGCVRFSAYADGSRLHQPYESVTMGERAAIFRSLRFAEPEFAQLARLADREVRGGAAGGSILTGARDGSEMGAFALEKNSIKERGLRIKLREYMPVGLTPVLIYVT